MRIGLRIILGLLVSLACLLAATRATDWHAVAAVLKGAHPSWILGTVLVGLLNLTIRAWRWCVLLRPAARVPLRAAFAATTIGFGATAVLPLRIGELIRPALLVRQSQLSMATALSSVVLERLLDVLMLVLAILALGFLRSLPPSVVPVARLLAPFVVVGLIVLTLAARQPARVEQLVERLMPRQVAGRLLPSLRGVLTGLESLGQVSTVGVVLLWSMLLWIVIAASFATAALALDLPAPLLASSLLIMVTVAAFVFLPQGPGFVGTWQAGCVVALRAFDVPHELAIGYSLLTWVVMIATNLGTAAVCIASEGFSLQTVLATRTATDPDRV